MIAHYLEVEELAVLLPNMLDDVVDLYLLVAMAAEPVPRDENAHCNAIVLVVVVAAGNAPWGGYQVVVLPVRTADGLVNAHVAGHEEMSGMAVAAVALVELAAEYEEMSVVVAAALVEFAAGHEEKSVVVAVLVEFGRWLVEAVEVEQWWVVGLQKKDHNFAGSHLFVVSMMNPRVGAEQWWDAVQQPIDLEFSCLPWLAGP
mmetsp:Transcript_24887/g.37597  ORF Transcript_24887/g.37597 Transcript_24887/m.37597 type:complete len:202 (-) Transcript_24887:2826-3431(-)